jgi:RHS repeat-associated protein
MKPVAKNIQKKTVSLALAFIFALAPLQPLLAQDNKTQPAQPPVAPSPVPKDDTIPPAADSTPISSPSPETTATHTPASSGDADPLFVSQTQASQKSSQLKADESSGALHYDYPLEVPPGRNGLQPDLKLSYNSQNLEDGSMFGYGWTINIPYIQRKNTHGTDKLYSGFDFTSALSGDLVATNTGNSTFIARVDDGGYLKYSLDSNLTTWTVQSKQGLTYIFGATAKDRQDDPTNPDHVFTWLLSSIVDSNGNTETYTYYKDGGQVYPDTISYSGIYEISFSRIARQDPYHGYRTGFSVTSAYVISSIQVRINNSVAKSYLLTYSNNLTTNRSRLQSVAVQDATRTYPPTTFDYQVESGKGFNATWSSISVPVDLKSGVFPVDVNGDSYPDLIKAYEWNYGYYSSIKNISINHPESNDWQIDLAWLLPPKIMIDTDGAWNRNVDSGTRVADLNGDLKPDLLRYENICFICTTDQEVNTGSGWSETTSWFSPINTNGGTRTVLDLNGDGLTDVLGTNGVVGSIQNFQTSISLNNGSDFTTYRHYTSAPPDPSMPYTDAPEFLNNYLEVDINADGLPDLIKSSWYYGYPTSRWEKKIYLNTGSGWTEDTTWTFPDVCYYCQGSAGQSYNTIYFQDFNNDGYVDFVIPGGLNVNNQQLSYSNVYINNGHGWTEDTGWYSLAYFYSDNCFCQNPALFFDGNADGSPDIYISNQSGNGYPSTNIFENKNHNQVDLLSMVTLPSGGTINVTYKTSAQYRDTAGNLLNPKLPLNIQTVEKIITDDKNGSISSTTYSYADGCYYYNGPFDRKFAGFERLSKTDEANHKIVTYYQQGDATRGSQGEFEDHISKAGKPYRIEVWNANGRLMQVTINKWDRYDQGNGANFVKLTQTLTQTFDGNGTHKDEAESYVYDDTTGNLIEKTQWGEVQGNSDGTFIDVGTDKYVTVTNYVSDAASHIVGLPSQEMLLDQSGIKVKETKYYYDDSSSLGTVEKGNLTKEERWKTGTSYIALRKAYNDGGLVTDEWDPRSNHTTYAYDSYNLYPATVTNALGQVTRLSYDYSSGQVKQRTDPNGRVFQTLYDGLNRVLVEKQPDVSSPSTLIIKTAYSYTDLPNNTSIKRIDYLTGSLAVNSYVYLDGLGRVIQERRQAEATNQYVVKDYQYDSRGLLRRESLPYFANGSDKASPTTNDHLYTSYTYDSMQRVKTVTTVRGTTTTTYDDWKVTITDPQRKRKDLYKDAYERLVRVDEHDKNITYTTTYTYNGLNKLTGIIDALGNVRQFTYDGLGQRLTAQDVHAPQDTGFGTWSYGYDDSGNLTDVVKPSGAAVHYDYDPLNRIKSEDYLGTPSFVDVVYTYDTCVNGKGRKCGATVTGGIATRYQYDPLGRIARETRVIDRRTFVTSSAYDRQGNLTLLTQPDGSQVQDFYNRAGLIERIQERSRDGQWNVIVSNFDYVPTGKVSLQMMANGQTSTNEYDPDDLYRLKRKLTVLANDGGRKVQDLNYTYDLIGNITQIVDVSATNTRKTTVYGYDDLYRLTSATVTSAANGQNYRQTFSYDAVGNILIKSDLGTYRYGEKSQASFPNSHAVTSITGANGRTTRLLYDRNGNLYQAITAGTQPPPGSLNLNFQNSFDYNDRLAQTITANGSTVQYAYDDAGQRIAYIAGGIKTLYPSQFYNVAGNTITKHIFAGSQLVVTIQQRGTSKQLYYMATDHLSSSTVASNQQGRLEELTDYYPYGDIRLDEKASTFTEQRKFTGHELDQDTGFIYAQARYYHGGIGRFFSQDPAYLEFSDEVRFQQRYKRLLEEHLADPKNLNSYSYANNNPLIYIDQNGAIPSFASLTRGVIKNTIAFVSNSTAAGVNSTALSLATVFKGKLDTANFVTFGLISPLGKLQGFTERQQKNAAYRLVGNVSKFGDPSKESTLTKSQREELSQQVTNVTDISSFLLGASKIAKAKGFIGELKFLHFIKDTSETIQKENELNNYLNGDGKNNQLRSNDRVNNSLDKRDKVTN